jgi:hypothetical protein
MRRWIGVVVLLLLTVGIASSQDRKISDLSSGNPAQAGDLIPIARSGANYSITPASINALGGVQGPGNDDLTESSETAVAEIVVPQTAGSNFADALFHYVVYATDGTDSQALRGGVYLSAVNKAGTESCAVTLAGTEANTASSGTLTCTVTCITGLTNVIRLGFNCTSSLSQTTLSVRLRADTMQANTVTFNP